MKKNKKLWWNKFWSILTLLLTVTYLVWRIGFTIPHDKGILSVVFWVILLLAEIFGLLEMAVHLYNMYDYGLYRHKLPGLPAARFPDVDVFVPTVNEPVEVLEATLTACLAMNYPSRDKIHIYLCDDGERQQMQELASRLGVGYLTRTEHHSAKAGNLNAALRQTTSPLIAVFDADMMPRPDFLMHTVPYFGANVRQMDWKKGKGKKQAKSSAHELQGMMGFVQTPQHFYQPDLFQHNLRLGSRIPNEQDYFYRVVQLAKNKTNSVIFGGSNTLLSGEALEHIGGFVEQVVTEDFATGIELQKAGYQAIAVDEVLADGMTVHDFGGLMRQRRRWARGCIQSGRRTHYLRSKTLTFAQKINYLTSISYWYSSWKRLIYLLAPLLFALFGTVVVECTLPQVLIFWLPMYLATNLCMRRFADNIRTTRWTDIYETTFFPYLLVAVLLETFGIRQKQFHVTRKQKSKRTSHWYYTIPYLVGAGASVWGIVELLKTSWEQQTPTYGVILFWLLINLYYLLVALVVAIGRSADGMDCDSDITTHDMKKKGENA